jgi:Uma2 family endonuclease
MSTVIKIGPEDHGRPMSLEEYLTGDYQQGYHYELIDGRLYVSPEASFPENWVERWLFRKVDDFSREHPKIINYVTNKARVFVPGRPGITAPEPDLAAYHNFPLHRPIRKVRWQDVSPVLVGEILTMGDPAKDLIRNVELYLLVPSIKEYWLFDTREDPEQPILRVYRRHGKKWRIQDFAFGETYTTSLLPGFRLLIDPRK